MKKSVFLFCTNPIMLLTELPLAALLTLAIVFNNKSAELLKLYPLITVISIFMIFLFIYFFRVIVISREEIKIIGKFSSGDQSIINEGKRLVLTLKPKRQMSVELFGNDGKAPELDWAKNDSNYVPKEINLFREKAFAGAWTARRVLGYFCVPKDTCRSLLLDGGEFNFNGDFTVSCVKNEDITSLEIVFLKTL